MDREKKNIEMKKHIKIYRDENSQFEKMPTTKKKKEKETTLFKYN